MNVKIRTITLGLGDPHPIDEAAIHRAVSLLRAARASLEKDGYTVQTIRIATRPLLEDMKFASDETLITYAQNLQSLCDSYEITYLGLGPAPADNADFPLERIT